MKNATLKYLLILSTGLLFSTNANAQQLEKPKQFSAHKVLPLYGFKKKGNNALFQGNTKKKKYFEGWYFKMVSADENSILSIIPGISLSENGEEQHAFIQVINGATAETYYFNFAIEDFYFSRKEFAVRLGDNYFSDKQVIVQLKNDDIQIEGKVQLDDITPLKIKHRQPAIMGWYRFVPFMECYHGVVSLTHQLQGNITVNNADFNFNNGRGYIEKDWGESMPEAWIWMQSNHFTDTTTSYMLSIANIPWLGKSFTGFLGFFHHQGETFRFATYGKERLTVKRLTDRKLIIKIENRKRTLIIETENKQSGLLAAPVKGSMDRRIAESVDSFIKVSLLDKEGKTVYVDSTNTAGLEMVGEIEQLMGTFK